MSAMLVVMTVRTVLKVLFEKAAPPCPSDFPATLFIADEKRRSTVALKGIGVLKNFPDSLHVVVCERLRSQGCRNPGGIYPSQ